MTTIVYLHGFNSGPTSIKAKALERAIGALPDSSRPEYFVPHLHHHPAVAMRAVAAWLETREHAALTFIGSSLGGYYATYLAEKFAAKAVLINPAIHPWDDLLPYLGPQANPHTLERYELTREHFAELHAMQVTRIAVPERYFLLVQSGDDLLDWREAVAFYAGAWQFVEGGGDHAFSSFPLRIPAVLRFAGIALT